MANGLRANLSKLRHDGHITDAEYQAFIKKMDGHDGEVYNKGYEEGKSRQLFAEIKIDKDMLLEMIDEKIKEFEVDIKATRNKAIDEFAEKLNTDVESFVAEVDGVRADLLTLDYFSEFVFEVAEQLKGVQE